MKHSFEELIQIAHRYYRKHTWPDGRSYVDSDEQKALTEACKSAFVRHETWRGLLDRIRLRFQGITVEDRALHLVSGCPPSYEGNIMLPTINVHVGVHHLVFLVSVLAPYYVIYSERFFYLEDHPGLRNETPYDPFRHLSHSRLVRLELLSEEAPYARGIAEEIEANFPGYEPMMSDVGKVIVPGVCTSCRSMDEANIYDCLFSDVWFPNSERIGIDYGSSTPLYRGGFHKNAWLACGAMGSADNAIIEKMAIELFGGAKQVHMLAWGLASARHRADLPDHLVALEGALRQFISMREIDFVGRPQNATEDDVKDVRRLTELVSAWLATGEPSTEMEPLARRLYEVLGGEAADLPPLEVVEDGKQGAD